MAPARPRWNSSRAVLAAENPALRVYWVDPGDMRTQMHQDAFPGEDISDRPLPEESVPGLLSCWKATCPAAATWRGRSAPRSPRSSLEDRRLELTDQKRTR